MGVQTRDFWVTRQDATNGVGVFHRWESVLFDKDELMDMRTRRSLLTGSVHKIL